MMMMMCCGLAGYGRALGSTGRVHTGLFRVGSTQSSKASSVWLHVFEYLWFVYQFGSVQYTA